MIFRSPAPPLPDSWLPDDLTLAQFMLDGHAHPLRQNPKDDVWYMDDRSGQRRTFGEIKKRTFGLANAIKLRWNLQEDDVVCIYSPNHIDYPTTVWAVHRLGGIVSPANPSYTKDELVYQLNLVNAKLVITDSAALDVAKAAVREVGLTDSHIIVLAGPDQALPGSAHVESLIADGLGHPQSYQEKRLKRGEGKTKLAFLTFSSGTTGRPKAVAVPHCAPMSNIVQIAAFNADRSGVSRFRPGQVSLGVLPFYHSYALYVIVHAAVFVGHNVVVMPKFHLGDMLSSICRHKITHLWLVPPMLVLLCKHPIVKDYDLSHVSYAIVGAAPVSPDMQALAQTKFPNMALYQGYGMTETCCMIAMAPYGWKNSVIGCAGHLISSTEARILRPDGKFAGYNEVGELHIRGPQLALGYYKNAEATKETFDNGWVLTGDVVLLKENGDLFVVDRSKEFLKVRGFQVAPAELESHLITHSDVDDACVVGIEDDYSGELPVAFVVLSSVVAEHIAYNQQEIPKVKNAIKKHVEAHKVNYKWLHDVVIVQTIPKTPSGKILRRQLRAQAREMWKDKADTKAKL